MNKGKHTVKKYKVIEVYTVLLIIATLFMSIGYAKISDIESNIEGEIEATNQEGVFITNIETSDETNTTINYYIGTMVDSKIILGSSSSTITYHVTLYNNTERDQIFIGVLTDDTNETLYSNTNIEYTLNGLEEYVTTIAPKERLTFTITFKYKTGASTSNNTLESKLNFRFKELPTIELSNEGQTYTLEQIYPGYTPAEYEFTVTNYNATITNTVPMTYYFETEIDTPLEVKIYDESGKEVTGNISIGGTTQETHTYTAKIIWDSSKDSTSYRGQNYNCNITLKAKPEDEKYLSYVIAKEFNVNIITNTKPTVTVASSNVEAKTATITATGADADNDILQYTLVVNNKTYGPSTTKTWNITGLTGSTTYSYTVTVTDGKETETATGSFTTLTDNVAPVIATNSLNSRGTTSITVNAKATDSNGDKLIYKLYTSTSQNGTYTLKETSSSTAQNTQITLTASSLSNYTTYWWYITVTDGSLTTTSSKQSTMTYCPGTGNTCTTSSCSGPVQSKCSSCGGDGIISGTRYATLSDCPDCNGTNGEYPRYMLDVRCTCGATLIIELWYEDGDVGYDDYDGYCVHCGGPLKTVWLTCQYRDEADHPWAAGLWQFCYYCGKCQTDDSSGVPVGYCESSGIWNVIASCSCGEYASPYESGQHEHEETCSACTRRLCYNKKLWRLMYIFT